MDADGESAADDADDDDGRTLSSVAMTTKGRRDMFFIDHNKNEEQKTEKGHFKTIAENERGSDVSQVANRKRFLINI